MKKVILAALAIMIMSGVSFASDNGKKKAKKAKIECSKNCTDTKNCHKNAVCINKPGCVCD
jgi:hypothetical protein